MASDLELPVDAPNAPPFFDELDEAIAEGRMLGNEHADYVPENMDIADNAGRRLARLLARRDEIEQQYKVWKARMDGWRKDELARLQPGIDLYNRWLELYGLHERMLNPKRATFTLPSVEIKTRQEKAASVELEIEEAVIEWARTALNVDEFSRVVKTTEKVLISELRKLVKIKPVYDNEADLELREIVGYQVLDDRTGEIVPGVRVDPPETTASVHMTQ